MMKPYQAVVTEGHKIGNVTVFHEVDFHHNHRLNVGEQYSDWVAPQEVAILVYGKRKFVALTCLHSRELVQVYEILSRK
jgi:hypothetical protein